MKIAHFQRGSKQKQEPTGAHAVMPATGFRGPACAEAAARWLPSPSLRKQAALHGANAARFPGAVTGVPHSLERVSSLKVNHPSLQRRTYPAWLAGWLAGGHLHPMKMLVSLQMTPLLGSLQLGSAWKLLLCVGKVFPPSAERNRRQGEGCKYVPVTSPRSWLLDY